MDENLRLVLNYAMDHQIGFQCTDVLSPITPCGSNPKRRMILINTNFHDKIQLPYQAAHEVGHVLNQDEGCLYMFSYSKASAEGGANKRAIDILIPMYFADINQEDANVQRFLDAFHIPSKMSDWAFDSIQKFYGK